MEEKKFLNVKNQEVHYVSWEIASPKAVVVISHGMSEHPKRYQELANYLNQNQIGVYAIYHIGHGEYAKTLGHMDKGDIDICVSNVDELIQIAKNKFPCKVFLLGHSMGSFISQLYVTRFHNIDGLILAGSTKASFKMKCGFILAKLVCKDLYKTSYFMDKMSFSTYNKKYKNVKTDFDWLNRDEEEVKKYINDPYCGWVGTNGFFYNLTYLVKEMGKKKNIKNVSKELPIFIHGGSMDPVSNYKRGLIGLYKQYQKLKIQDVTLTIYEDGRHEIYNEINKKEVFKNTLDFINNHL